MLAVDELSFSGIMKCSNIVITLFEDSGSDEYFKPLQMANEAEHAHWCGVLSNE